MCGRVGARARAQAQASARTLYVWCMYASRNVTLRTVDEIDPIVSPELVRVRARARPPARLPVGTPGWHAPLLGVGRRPEALGAAGRYGCGRK